MTQLDVPARLEYASRVQKMIRDPDLTDDALLFALAALDVLDRRRMQGRRNPTTTKSDFLRDVAESATNKRSLWWVKGVITNDIPRYEIKLPGGIKCGAPMIRREGPCGKNTSSLWLDREPETGVQSWTGYCNRHLTREVEDDRRRRAADWEAHGKPSPGPNKGGILARYFKADWTALYAWASPSRPPLDGAVEPTPPRPIFTLIEGGGA